MRHCLLAVGLGFLIMGSVVSAADPRIVAHRGLLRHTPENTMTNFRSCLNLKLGFEFDVRRAKDGTLVCVHDDTLDRTTNGTGRVAEKTLLELKKLDAGSWFDPRFRGQRIPTIDEIFTLIEKSRVKHVLITVDLKAEGVEADVVALALKHGILDQLLMIGNTIDHPEVRQKLRAADSSTHVACVANTAAELQSAIDDKLSDWVYVRYVPSRDEIAAIHQAGKKSFIAGPTVASEQIENWSQVTEAGIDGILTDYPLSLAEQLRVKNQAETR
ncbi:MAG TPA: glycerophosphodiester phosphodiesterase family protein [Planctomycetaceae bacterium]|nr:glycerophosphodiester phosphodiesterase family protein [Planctomycetaceae bacterium]